GPAAAGRRDGWPVACPGRGYRLPHRAAAVAVHARGLHRPRRPRLQPRPLGRPDGGVPAPRTAGMGVGSASLKMLAASLARYGGQVALLAVIAHTAGPVAVGQFALALAITAPIFILTGLGLRTVVVTLKTPFTSGDVLAVRATTTALALAASLAAGGLVPSADWRVVALVAAIKVADAFSDVIYGLYQVAGRFT